MRCVVGRLRPAVRTWNIPFDSERAGTQLVSTQIVNHALARRKGAIPIAPHGYRHLHPVQWDKGTLEAKHCTLQHLANYAAHTL